MEYRNLWGEDRVYFHDAEEQLRSIPANCTDVGGVDPLLAISKGRCFFRYQDLIKLADLLEELDEAHSRV